MSMYGNYPNPDVCRHKKHWVYEKSGCIAGCNDKIPDMEDRIDAVIDSPRLKEDLRIVRLVNIPGIETAIKTVQDFLNLFPANRVLSPEEQSFVCEALDKVLREAKK